MTTQIDLEFDFNNLFNMNLTYSFDVLKGALKAFVDAQNTTNKRLLLLEGKLKDLNDNNTRLKAEQEEIRKIQNSFEHFKNKENVYETDNDESMLDDKKKKQKKTQDIVYDTEENVVHANENTLSEGKNELEKKIFTKKEETEEDEVKDDIPVVKTLTSDSDFKQLLRRVNKLENHKDNTKEVIQVFLNDLNSLKLKVKKNTDQIDTNYFHAEKSFEKVEGLTTALDHRVDALENKLEDIKKNVENLNIQIMDANFNFIEQKKDIPEVTTGGTISSDIVQAIIQNLEKKMFKKFDFIDEKNKKEEDDIYKLKGEVHTLKGMLDTANANHLSLTERVDKNTAGINENKTNIQNSFETLNKTITDKTDAITQKFEADIKSIRGDIAKLFDLREEDLKTDRSKEDQVDLKAVKELTKKINDLETKLKLFIGTANIELLNKEITQMKEQLTKKPSSDEVEEVKNSITQHTNQITFLKDNMVQIMEDRKIIDDVNWLRRKFESLSSLIQNLKLNEDDERQAKVQEEVRVRYLEYNTFMEFQKKIIKDLNTINIRTDENKRSIDDLYELIKEKPSAKDLKALEDFFLGKTDELKIGFSKRFADKLDTHKNLKYLDTQIKHIIDVYIKKMEKGDNWLLAKKPLGGTSCASCEAYIGDLHNTNQYLAWQKYPVRDISDTKYRVGNGFSKMLNHLNLETTKRSFNHPSLEQLNEHDMTSHGRHLSSVEITNANKTTVGFDLPKLNRKTQKDKDKEKDDNLNSSAENVNVLSGNESESDLNQPKIVKIYKKKTQEK